MQVPGPLRPRQHSFSPWQVTQALGPYLTSLRLTGWNSPSLKDTKDGTSATVAGKEFQKGNVLGKKQNLKQSVACVLWFKVGKIAMYVTICKSI